MKNDPNLHDTPDQIEPQAAEPARWRSLLVSIGFLLSIAILPIGLIAVSQVRQAIERTKTSYLDEMEIQTARAAQPERDAIVAAFGLAKGLASVVAKLDRDDPVCADIMARSQHAIPDVQFVGFVHSGGLSSCNNYRRAFDFSDNPSVQEGFRDPQPRVTFNPAGRASGEPVMIVAQPVYADEDEDEFLGFISMSLIATSMTEARATHRIPAALDLLTFNAEGDVLTADMVDQPLEDIMPGNISLVTMGEIAPKSFEAKTRDGELRYFSVTPIYPGEAYTLASWDPRDDFLEAGSAERTTLVFTIAMWLAGLLMALGALYFLAVRPLSSLGRRMRRFASGRRVVEHDGRDIASRELFTINRIFEQMARKIIRDEAELENALYERDVLLREVHHRVKNNLQLISSILNMELRKSETPETRQKITRLQARLSGLASVYRGLYESESFSSVRMDTLLEPLLRQLSLSKTAGLEATRLSFDLAPVELVPDQAAQLALLSVEAFSNALDHHGPDGDGDNAISVTLTDGPGEDVTFELVNTVSGDSAAEPQEGTLGAQLINAFVMQLGGEAKRLVQNGQFRLQVRFKKEDFEPDPQDSTIPGTRTLLAR